ncbi:MAG: hypothetical protein INR73_15345 [Williamsia sp.]|nr:hypothetical protein [Williamsia sp.]
MELKIEFEQPPNEALKADAQAIADQLRNKIEPFMETIEKEHVQLTLYFLETGTCRLLIDASPELQKEISDLVGPVETWTK